MAPAPASVRVASFLFSVRRPRFMISGESSSRWRDARRKGRFAASPLLSLRRPDVTADRLPQRDRGWGAFERPDSGATAAVCAS